MHKKEECALPEEVAYQTNLSKNASTISNTKINEWRCPTIILLASVKSIFLKAGDSLCVLENVLTFKSFSFLDKMI